MTSFVYVEGATLPNLVITPTDDDGQVVDLTDGELALRVGRAARREFEKLTGLTVNPDLTVEVDWDDTGEIGDLAPGTYLATLIATFSGEQRRFNGELQILDAVA